MSSFFRQQLEEWVKNIDVKADRVLDVGGAQLPIKGRTKSWDVGEYGILDLPEPHKTSGLEVDFTVRADISLPWFRQGTEAEYMSQYTDYHDVVFCLEVAEYWMNPGIALNHIFGMLKPGGTLYISFPFIYPQHAPEGKDYLRYTRWGAEKLLTDAGFTDLEVVARVAQNSLMGLWASEKMHPLKGYEGHDEIGYMIKCRKA